MQHIILIGFKHVGKSTIAKLLSEKIPFPLIDLDREIESRHKKKGGESLTCRELFTKIGEHAFRELEHETLFDILTSQSPLILSLGGGTPTHKKNRNLIKNHTVVYITSPKEAVYERIMLAGKPAFLSPDENSYESFARLWEERKKMYESMATITVENTGSLIETTEKIITLIPKI